jgi:hypothetical protein
MVLIFEKQLLLIQTNCKYWVWKEKSVEPSMCSHAEVFNSKIVKNKKCVHTWANNTIYTNIKWILEMKMVHLL